MVFVHEMIYKIAMDWAKSNKREDVIKLLSAYPIMPTIKKIESLPPQNPTTEVNKSLAIKDPTTLPKPKTEENKSFSFNGKLHQKTETENPNELIKKELDQIKSKNYQIEEELKSIKIRKYEIEAISQANRTKKSSIRRYN